jgi:hypothetical protein
MSVKKSGHRALVATDASKREFGRLSIGRICCDTNGRNAPTVAVAIAAA